MAGGRQALANALQTFIFSLSQGAAAQAQLPGARGARLGMAAALGAPMQLQEIMRRRQMEDEERKQRAEGLRRAAATGDFNAIMEVIKSTQGMTQAPEIGVPKAPLMMERAPQFPGGPTPTQTVQPEGTNQIAQPLPPFQVPLPNGQTVTIPRQSAQDVQRGVLELARQKAAIEQEYRPDRFIPLGNGQLFDVQTREIVGKSTKTVNAPNLQVKTIEDPSDPSKPLNAIFNPDTGETLHPDTKKVIKSPRDYQRKDESIAAMRDLQATFLRLQLQGGGLTPSQRATEINTLRGQWTMATKPILERRQAVAKLDAGEAALKAKNFNAATQIIVTAFNKLQDETSVVREGEYQRSEQGQALLARIQGSLEKLSRGGSALQEKDLRELATEAKNVAKELERVQGQSLGDMRESIEKTLDDYKIPHDRVFGSSTIGKRNVSLSAPNGSPSTVQGTFGKKP